MGIFPAEGLSSVNDVDMRVTTDAAETSLKVPPSWLPTLMRGNVKGLALLFNAMPVVTLRLDWAPSSLGIYLRVVDEHAPPGIDTPAGYAHEWRTQTLRTPPFGTPT